MKKKGGPLLLLNDGENEKKRERKENTHVCVCIYVYKLAARWEALLADDQSIAAST